MFTPSFYIGVVENRMDPLKLGRCQVRIFGIHTHSSVDLPTEDLPWATMIQSITSAAMTGIGQSPLGLVEGSWVLVNFFDKDKQKPFIIGSLGGIPQDLSNVDTFKDSSGKYPLEDLKKEPDTNRLARHDHIDNTIVALKETTVDKDVPIANSQSVWNQSPVPYNSSYPFNHVYQTESHHLFEYDDTPSCERIHRWHKTGTFDEIDHNGTKVEKIVGNSFTILEKDGYLHIKGNVNVCVDGAKTLLIKDTMNVQIYGTTNINIHDDLNLNVSGDFNLSVGKNFNVDVAKKTSLKSGDTIDTKSGKNTNVEAGSSINMKASGDVNSQGSTVNLKASGNVAMDGSTTMIQSGVSKSAGSSTTTPINKIADVNPNPVPLSVLTVNTRTK